MFFKIGKIENDIKSINYDNIEINNAHETIEKYENVKRINADKDCTFEFTNKDAIVCEILPGTYMMLI